MATSTSRIVVVDPSGEMVQEVRAAANCVAPVPEIVGCPDLRRAEALVAQHRVDVLVAGPALTSRGGLHRLAAFHRREPHFSLLLAVDGRPDASLREIIQAGADDILPAAIEAADLAVVLERSLEIARRRRTTWGESGPELPHPSPRGQIVTVVSPTGGGGKTFVATNLALFLARQTGKRVVLVDLDLEFGEVSVALRLRADYTISDVLRHDAEDGELAEHLSEFLVPHREGFFVLAAPRHPGEANAISAADVGRLLEILKTRADYVVVDTPPALNDTVLAALDLSDHLLALATADVPSVHNLRVFLRTMHRLRVPPESISLVLNKAELDVGFDLSRVAALFPQGFAAILPYDREVSRSINLGTPLLAVSPEAEVSRKLIAALAAFLPEGERPAPDRPASPKRISKLRLSMRRASATPRPEPAPILTVARLEPEPVATDAIAPVGDEPVAPEQVVTQPVFPPRQPPRSQVRTASQKRPASRRPVRGPARRTLPRRRLHRPEARSPPGRQQFPPVENVPH